MFYIKEIFIRFQYVVFSFFLSLVLAYIYKNVLLVLISFSLLNTSDALFIGTFSKFIYNHPLELITVQIQLCFMLSFLFVIPYSLWQLLDFIKSSLVRNEFLLLSNFTFAFVFVFFFSNLFCFIYLFPNIWFFFQSMNFLKETAEHSLVVFFELRVQDFFSFMFDFLFLINVFVLILLVVSLLIFFFGITSFIYWKKFFILINIMFATFLSPPDVYSQIVIFFVLSCALEFILVIYLYYFKINQKSALY